MSVQLIAWAFAQKTGSPTRKAVLLALANRANHDSGLCCPSIDRLAKETDLSRRSVFRALADLEEAGFIQRVRRQRENGSDTSNEYRFHPGASVSPPQVHSDTPPSVTVSPPEPEVRTRSRTSRAAPQKERERNLIWDALTDIFGAPTTRTAETLRGRIVQSLTAAGATPDEIQRRARSWPSHFDTATLTATALEKHWDALGRPPMRRR